MQIRYTQPYEATLREMRSSLLTQVREQRGGTLGRADVAAERFNNAMDDRALFATEHDLDVALGERETQELHDIDGALERIRLGRFGLCTDCSAVIALARLQLNPHASRCLACQRTHEFGQSLGQQRAHAAAAWRTS